MKVVSRELIPGWVGYSTVSNPHFYMAGGKWPDLHVGIGSVRVGGRATVDVSMASGIHLQLV